MPIDALGLLIVVLLMGYPWLQGYRERALVRRLERARDPQEAAMIVDAAIMQNEAQADTLRNINRFR